MQRHSAPSDMMPRYCAWSRESEQLQLNPSYVTFHLWDVTSTTDLSGPQSLHLYSGNKGVDLTELLKALSDLKYLTCKEQCLAHNKCYLSISFYYCSCVCIHYGHHPETNAPWDPIVTSLPWHIRGLKYSEGKQHTRDDCNCPNRSREIIKLKHVEGKNKKKNGRASKIYRIVSNDLTYMLLKSLRRGGVGDEPKKFLKR